MRFSILCFLLLTRIVVVGQINLTTEQKNRLADAGKIYGYVKFFHPYLQYKNINWDSAFASTVPHVIAAKNKNEYEQSLNKLFEVLNDGMTTVLNTQETGPSKPPLSFTVTDSIMVIDMTNFNELRKVEGEGSTILQRAFDSVKHVKGVIIDLRWDGASLKDRNNIQGVLDWQIKPERHLLSSRTYGPSYRTVMYTGFPGEANQNERLYEAAFKQHVKASFTGQAKKDMPTVFIVNRFTKLPLQFLAMHENGKAAILQEEGIGDIAGSETRFYVTDSVLIRLRLGEMVNRDGSIGLKANDTYSIGDPQLAIQKAKELLVKGFSYPTGINVVPEAPLAKQTTYVREGTYPSVGYRVLAAAKIFSVIDHFYPNKHLMDSSWESMYRNYLPQFITAKDSIEYMQAVAQFYRHLDDGHGFMNSRVDVVHHHDYTSMVIGGRFIDNQLVVTNILNDSMAKFLGITKGDIVMFIDGKRPMQMYEDKKQYIPASNEPHRLHTYSDFLLMGNNGSTRQITIRKANGIVNTIDVPISNKFIKNWFVDSKPRHDQPMLRFINKDIGYVDLDKLQLSDIDSMFNLFRNTKAIIFDMRGHPNVTAWQIAARLTEKKNVIFTKYTWLTPSAPNISSIDESVGRQHILSYFAKLPAPKGFIYKGKTVLLIDENTISQGEGTGLMFKAANNTTFIGSQTAGANGNVSNFIVPGRINLYFSGLNVSYPNGETMQRVGLKPDIKIRPTIKGIQAGKDEVLERAVKYLQTGN